MAAIIQLDDALSNKIAAGEVVERPASVVKELIENALDANSTHVLLEVEEGGLTSIRVVDNGSGMDEIDVEAAFFRHATSKIKTDRDLFRIMTLGFRGEALPSIASVSHLTIATCTGEGPGVELSLEGGNIISKRSAQARKGTEITVTHLFYNTPARLKYLKTVHTEMGNISDIINRMALAHPHVAFECYHNGKEFLRTAGNGDLRQVIAAIYGRNVAQKMKAVRADSLDYSIKGYAALPELTRASRQYISLFINGRFIKNFALTRAIQEGYHTLLPIGRYPIVILSIEMDPTLVDVNVHPTKLEVRLSKEEELGQLITRALKEVFQKETLIPSADTSKKIIDRKGEKSEQLPLDFEEKTNGIRTDKEQTFGVSREEVKGDRNDSNKPLLQEARTSFHIATENEDEAVQAVHYPTKKQDHLREEKTDWEQPAQEEAAPMQDRLPTLYPIGQMHGTYIVAQNETGMYLIDQHAAQERIKYEFFREKVGQVKAEVQDLLIPITFECTAGETAIITEYVDELRSVGVFLETFGQHAFIVRSHPTWLPKGYEEETIREMIDYLLEKRTIDIAKLREKAAILMSCKAAIKANRHLRQDEMFALLESLRRSSDPFTCPHGRPILIHFSTYEIEKMFKRIM